MTSGQATVDPHAPYVKKLADAGDWPALARYWMAHGAHTPALTEAIRVLRAQALVDSPYWGELARLIERFAEDPFEGVVALAEFDHESLNQSQRFVVDLLIVFPRLILCEMGDRFPIDRQEAVISEGIETAELVFQLAVARDEPALATFAKGLLAKGRQALSDLESARASYDEALAIRRDLARARPEVYRPHVASTLNNLGNVQRDLGDPESARASFDEALAVYRDLARARPEAYRPHVAGTLTNLGNVRRDLGELESARASFDEALALRRDLARARPEVHRPDVAMTLNSLGNVRRDLGELESARASFDEALAAYRDLARARPEVYRPDVAMTLNNLGNVQRDLNDLESSRVSYNEALAAFRDLARAHPDVYRPYVAGTLNNLGNVQRDLNDPESARAGYDEALAIRRDLARARPDAYRPDVAKTLNNLGSVLSILNELESARASFDEALAAYRDLARARPEAYRPDVALTLSNLGNVQRDLGELESAWASFDEALAAYRDLARARPEAYRLHVASTLNNLGNVLSILNELESARASFDEALAIRRDLARARPEVHRPDVAMTLSNLGNVQRNLNDPESARASYDEALTIRRDLARARPEVYRPDVAMTLNSLGNVLKTLGDLEAARGSYDEAVELYDEVARRIPSAYLVERIGAWTNLARFLLNDVTALGWSDRVRARDVLRKAVECAGAFRGRFRDRRHRRRVQEEWLVTYELLVETNIDLWRFHGDPDALGEAVAVAESSRSRQLVEMLAEGLDEGSDDEFWELHRRLHDSYLRLADGGGSFHLRAGHEALKTEYDQSLRQKQAVLGPAFDPDRPLPPLAIDAIRALVPRDVPAAFVQYLITPRRCLALIITPEGIEVVDLPGLTLRVAFDLGKRWFQAYYGTCRRPNGKLDMKAWSDALSGLMGELSPLCVQPVAEALADRGFVRLVLAPHKVLHMFPLHAAVLANGQPLAKAFEVTYTPGLSILDRCRGGDRAEPSRLATDSNPTGDLVGSEAEAALIARHFDATRARCGAEVTRETLLDEPMDAHVWHYSGHSLFVLDKPLASGLVLESVKTPERWVTLRDMYARRRPRGTELTVLSSCESGMLQPELTDDFLNLPAGLLYAGSRCVVSSLWVVPDLASALLMDRFYAEWRGNKRTVAAALCEAQRWMREDIPNGKYVRDELVTETFIEPIVDSDVKHRCRDQAQNVADLYPDTPPYAHPAYWAAFTATGWAFPKPESLTTE